MPRDHARLSSALSGSRPSAVILLSMIAAAGCSSAGAGPEAQADPDVHAPGATAAPSSSGTESSATRPNEATSPAGASGTSSSNLGTTEQGAKPMDPAPAPAATAAETATFTSASNQLAWDTFQELRAAPGDMVFSPISLSTALTMTWGGARGETATQMAHVLHVASDPEAMHRAAASLLAALNAADSNLQLRVVNRLFGDQKTPFAAPFLALMRDRYNAPLEQVDFRGAFEPARAKVNAWVDGATEHRIPEILPRGSVDALTRLVLANAVYFKGAWKSRFDVSQTTPRPFYAKGAASPRDVPTMRLTARFRYGEQPGGLQVLEMPYTGDRIAMTILLPRARDGLAELEKQMNEAFFTSCAAAARGVQQVQVLLPKLRIEMPGSVALKEPLSRLGMPLAFDRVRADFTGMSTDPNPNERLSIADVYHRAFVEVNEEGTEAAAATGVVMQTRSAAPRPPPEFRADHPFLFVLRDLQSGAILFIGRVTDPRS